jgi:hypothetical protein
MKLVASDIRREDMDLVWVHSYWDYPRDGLCRYRDRLWRFVCQNPDTDDNFTIYRIYSLNPAQQAWWRARQRLFELCVDYHWSYPQRAQGYRFGQAKRPRWLKALLWALYHRSLRSAWHQFYRKR